MLSWLNKDVICCNVCYYIKTFMMVLIIRHVVDIDECASSPCHNAGTCNDIVNGYTCLCSAGYNGDNCETGMSHIYNIVPTEFPVIIIIHFISYSARSNVILFVAQHVQDNCK